MPSEFLLRVTDNVTANVRTQSSGAIYTVSQLLRVAEDELGYMNKKSDKDLDDKTANAGSSPLQNGEFPGRYTKYARDLHLANYYQYYWGSKQGYHWCDMFVDWCFLYLVKKRTKKDWKDCKEEAEKLICQQGTEAGAGCPYSMSFYKNHSRFGHTPVKGAQIFFSYSGIVGHTGIVTGFDDNKVYTIEGNAGSNPGIGEVARCEYPRNSSIIAGYGYPMLSDLTVPQGYVAPDLPSTPPADIPSTPPADIPSTPPPADPDIITNSVSMKYTESNPPLYCPQTQSDNYVGTTKMTVRGVLWHSTACNAPELKVWVQPSDNATDKQYWLDLLGKGLGTDWNHYHFPPGERKGVTAWIGKLADGTVAAVQGMPWNFSPWGCGNGRHGSCNDGWIQFEICEDDRSSEEYFKSVYQEACQLTAYLCKIFNLDPLGTVEYNGVTVPVILDHKTSSILGLGSAHGDVEHWFKNYGKYSGDNDGMDIVRNDVAEILANYEGYPIIKTGDVVTVNSEAVSKDGQPVQSYILSKKWIVSQSESQSEYATLGECTEHSALVLNKEYLKVDLTVTEATGSVTPPSNTGTLTTEERIWNNLYREIGNAYGVAGIMGNMYKESGLVPNNLENYYAQTLTGLTGTDADIAYTRDVDNGTYTAAQFINDKAGYGLVQWTWWELKRDLLECAQAQNKSIGDLDMQCYHLCESLRTNSNYSNLWKILTEEATCVSDASTAFLLDFERPADQGSSVQADRASWAQHFYDRFSSSCTHPETYVRDKLDVTCSIDGYTGDTVCSSCNQTVEYGSIIPCAGHNYKNGVCSVCGSIVGVTDSTDFGLLSKEDLRKILKVLKSMLNR